MAPLILRSMAFSQPSSTLTDRVRLHGRVSAALKSGHNARAIAPLARLILSLPGDHPALPGLFTTLAFLHSELERWSRAESAARRALELSPNSGLAENLLARAMRRGAPCA